MNETLEAMARAIFKDWFVDFGPTRAKMEGRAPYLAPEFGRCFRIGWMTRASRRGGELRRSDDIADASTDCAFEASLRSNT